MRTTESQQATTTKLAKIAWLSSQNPNQTFISLMHLYNQESLGYCYQLLDGNKATGIDGQSKEDYGTKLHENIDELLVQMKRMAYRPHASRQVFIPKEGSKEGTRPLCISNFEDKIVQRNTQLILESIYDPIFVNWSFGFRPNRNCHDAIKALRSCLYNKRVETVIDVDLSNFFGSIDHEILLNLLQIKIKDSKFLRYIRRNLKAGVLSGKELQVSEEGVPQGSCCSPVLANVVAHYVIDEWIDEIVKPRLKGKLDAFRYADDLVICCTYKSDADRVQKALANRLARYGLKMNDEKTKQVNFSKIKGRMDAKHAAFDFLGFTFYLGKTRTNKIIPKVKTSGKRFKAKLKRVNEWARSIRNKGSLKQIWNIFRAKIRGHIQYYGVSFNSSKVYLFVALATKILFKWLNRRSQRKSFSWDKFQLYIKSYPLPPVITHVPLF